MYRTELDEEYEENLKNGILYYDIFISQNITGTFRTLRCIIVWENKGIHG